MDRPFDLIIERLAYPGEGLGHLEGKVVFVPGALPGERVTVEPIEVRERYLRGNCLDIAIQSAARRPLDCAHEFAEGCGGCGFRHVADRLSLELKCDAALSAMQRLAPLIEWPRPMLHCASHLDATRIRARFHIQGGKLGFYQRSSHDLVGIPRCRALHPDLLRGLELLQDALAFSRGRLMPVMAVLEVAMRGLFAYLEGPLDSAQLASLDHLVRSSSFAGIRWQGRKEVKDLGADWIEEPVSLPGRELRLLRRIGTFAQVNPEANRAIREKIHAILAASQLKSLVELFAGSGNFTLPAALTSNRITAVEGDPAAVEGLKASIDASKLPHVKVIRRDLARPLGRLLNNRGADLVLLDPPRAGAAKLIDDLTRSGAGTIVYLSCSPPHLARDLQALSRSFAVESLDVFDMFPRTPHLETLAVLRRT